MKLIKLHIHYMNYFQTKLNIWIFCSYNEYIQYMNKKFI